MLEGLQAQLTTLVEQLSMPLALLPSSNVLLEMLPEVLQKQLELIPGQPGHKPIQAVCTRCVTANTSLHLVTVVPYLACMKIHLTSQASSVVPHVVDMLQRQLVLRSIGHSIMLLSLS